MDLINSLFSIILPFRSSFLKFHKSVTNAVSYWDYCRFRCKLDKRIYWPVHRNSEITHAQNIYVGIDSNPGTRPGCYIQGNGGIYIGNYVHFASNIGVISGNHGVLNHTTHDLKSVYIDDYCWIGMNAIILPGVVLGKRTIVGAGSVVTKSFPDGFCVIAGNPAKIIKTIDKNKFVPTKYGEDFYGFIPKDSFETFERKYRKGCKTALDFQQK